MWSSGSESGSILVPLVHLVTACSCSPLNFAPSKRRQSWPHPLHLGLPVVGWLPPMMSWRWETQSLLELMSLYHLQLYAIKKENKKLEESCRNLNPKAFNNKPLYTYCGKFAWIVKIITITMQPCRHWRDGINQFLCFTSSNQYYFAKLRPNGEDHNHEIVINYIYCFTKLGL